MIRKYIVTIDSNKFEVEVEENGVVKSDKVAVPAVAPVQPVAAAPVAAAPVAAVDEPTVSVAAPADGNKVTAPLPGTLLKITAKQGTVVKEGDELCVIEAMKMENPIASPFSGTVVSVVANEGSMINAGDLILVIA